MCTTSKGQVVGMTGNQVQVRDTKFNVTVDAKVERNLKGQLLLDGQPAYDGNFDIYGYSKNKLAANTILVPAAEVEELVAVAA